MLASPVRSLSDSVADVSHAVRALRDAAVYATPGERADAACEALRAADELISFAVQSIDRNTVEDSTGLSPEMLLELQAGRMGSEARMMIKASDTLRMMPNLGSAFGDGTVSWGQVRCIVSAVKTVGAEGRAKIDEFIGAQAPVLADGRPERLIEAVDDEVTRQRADLLAARESRAIENSFLSIQPRLDGTAAFYAEADAETTATIVGALDTEADAPQNPERGGVTRAQQHIQALRRICEGYLNGASGGSMGPRPRILVTMDVKDLTDPACADAMRLFWPLTGTLPRLSAVARDMLLCDSIIVPVLFDRDQPVAVGNAAQTISGKVRTALVARDGGCRFPACTAPASWTDGHHIIPGYGNQVNDLVLLCRRCHRRLHAKKWRMKLEPDGGVTFTRRGQQHTTYPRHRSPPAQIE